MTIDVDARLRAASDSLQQASERLSPEHPPRHRLPAVLVAAVLVVLAVAAGLVAMQPDRDRFSTKPTPDIPRLVPETFPKEVPAPMAYDLPLTNSLFGDATAKVTVYGDPDATDPFARTDLAVVETAVDPVPDIQADDAAAVTVRNHDGTSGSTELLGTWVSWEERPERYLMVVSHTLDRQQLLTVAEGLTFQGGTATPTGLDRVSSVPDLPLSTLTLGVAPLVRASAVGHMVGSETTEYDHGVFVTTAEGGSSDIAVVRWLARASAPVTVRGHAGWTTALDGGRTLVWEEAPGLVVIVQTVGFPDAEALDIAQGLHPATDEEWRALLAAASAPPDEPDDSAGQASVFIEGSYTGGTWTVFNDPDGTICAELLPDDGESIDVCAEPDERAAIAEDHAGNPVVIYGPLPEAAAGVGAPEPVGPDRIQETEAGARFYALSVDGALPASVVFYDAAGQPVETTEVRR